MGLSCNICYPSDIIRELAIKRLHQEITDTIYGKFLIGNWNSDWKTVEVWFEREEDALLCMMKFGTH